MTNITIPPEALRAARAASMNALGDGEDPIRAACLAMLKAWPRIGPIRADQPIGDWCDKLPALILPLPQEVSDE